MTPKTAVSREYLEHIELALIEAQNWLVGLIDSNGLTDNDRHILEFIDGAVVRIKEREGRS